MSDLIQILRALPPAGRNGFEGLIAGLLEALTGFHFILARSGSQEGRDMSSRPPNGNVVAVECKRYGQDTELDERQLLGELIQAAHAIPDLDLWVLVTSREVPSQLSESLNRLASQSGLGFFALSSGDGNPSSLEVLCANSPKTLSGHSGVKAIVNQKEIKPLLNSISQQATYLRRLSAVKEHFSSPLVGYDNWRTQHNQSFLQALTTDQEARANFGQPINVEQHGVMLIRRSAAWDSLAKWYREWRDKHSFLAVLGEEGDGKTWGVASWLSAQVKSNEDFPAVIFLSSTDISEAELSVDLRPLFAELISRRLLGVPTGQSKRRLDRWLSRPSGDVPLFLLVFDGINERRSHEWWRGLLERLMGKPWSKQAAVLTTCRTSYWERYFQKLRHLPTSSFVVGPYNDGELNAALEHHNLRRESLQDAVLPLIRKPRYFDLMVKHYDQIAQSGDVTVARLLFEDWRDRWERKQAITLTVEDFQNVIRQLAQQHQGANYRFSEQQVADALPPFLDRQLILEELRTGGVLQASGGKYKVNDQSIVFGLGLLLVKQLEQTTATGQDPRETIGGWMEPHADMDMKAAICEFAALYVLGSNILPLEYKVALLESWVESHNPKQNTENDLTAYLPMDPHAYVALAEAVWSDAYDNRWAQEILTRSFMRWYDYSSVSTVLLAAFERWLGLVHIQGSPLRRNSTEEAERNQQKIAARLGRKVGLGSVQVGAYELTVIDDDGQLRLSRVALAVISHLRRNQFMRALATGCLADAIMGCSDKYELSSWVVRSSQQDVWPDLKQEVDQLLAIGSSTGRKAASRLLSFEGGAEASILQQTIPKETPDQSITERHDEDPCISVVQLNRAQCITCLQREDLNPDWMARQIRPYVIDPTLPVPQSFITRLGVSVDNINTDQMWVVLGTTGEDYQFETAEPALAAHAPNAIAGFIRLLARKISNRRGIERRQLSINLGKHYLVFLKDEQEAVKAAWEDLIAGARCWNKDDEEAEMFLFEVLLPHLNAENQLAALLRRPDNTAHLVVYENNFFPLPIFGTVQAQLANTTKSEVLHRILWFLAAHPSAVPVNLLETSIVPLLVNADSIVRSKVLELVYEIKDSSALNSVVNGEWTWDPSCNTFENHWGSLILCEHGKNLPFEELCRRVDPSYLGYAITCRGNDGQEVQQYAELVHQVWFRLITSNADVPLDLPPFTVESSIDGRVQHVSRWSLADSTERSIDFVSKYTRWGGVEQSGEANFEDWNADAAVENRRKLVEIVHEAITQQKNAGNVWFGQDFRGTGLDQVVTSRPDLIDQWITNADAATSQGRGYIRRGSSFYDALCSALLQKETEKGVKLYWQLQETHARMPVVDSETEIDLLDFALFDATQNDHLVAAWQRKLEECQSDQELMKVALLAQRGTGAEWLWSYISTLVNSAIPIDKARSRVLLGFFDGQDALTLIDQLLGRDPDTWVLNLVRAAKQWQDRRAFAKHWFNQFLSSNDDVTAWASFRLLLRCVESSFWFWREEAEERVGESKTYRRRTTFLEDNMDEIQRGIQKNEKEAAERFLGQKLLKRQVWPWM
jgi:hypothetical protein